VKHALKLWHWLTGPLYWLYEHRLSRAIHSNGAMPQHIGLILDGNRRFARASGLQITTGHEMGAHKAREVLEWCLELGIGTVTMWVFSTDNKNRDPQEVAHLLELFAKEAEAMAVDPKVHKHAVRIKMIGDLESFPEKVQGSLRNLEEVTKGYNKLNLNVAIGYGGREEIVSAVQKILRETTEHDMPIDELAQHITPEAIDENLYTAGIPDPDFVIRTSGEIRLSGFLLWQTAYSEYYFCDVNWPSFRRVDFLRAIRSYQARQRRFGK
jgi:short-chain Z-isoprenyl diphosphate synthase